MTFPIQNREVLRKLIERLCKDEVLWGVVGAGLLEKLEGETNDVVIKSIQTEVDELKDHKARIDNEIFQLDKRLRSDYINKDTFLPYQRAIITAISTVVVGVMMAVLNLTIKR